MFPALLFALIVTSCSGGSKTEVVEIDDIIPSSKRDYEYNDSISTENETSDPIIDSLKKILGKDVTLADTDDDRSKNDWTLIPNRFAVDTSVSRGLIVDSNFIDYRTWIYSDSIRTVNALYNWFDCFGDDCEGIVVGDSVNVTKGSFILLSNNYEISFIRSSKDLNFDLWMKIFDKDKKNTPWNYVLRQKPGGEIKWIKKTD